ncbi:ACAT-related protein required for viability 1 isoform X2 [Haematobia irritans]|uniref:ACAT-related protein required for viability 1 isoform X2 n=1 Tax=Haematobia irritans TaxID=7368 RepID=UPI003F4F618B
MKQNKYTCVNCGNKLRNLHKEYSSTVKPISCLFWKLSLILLLLESLTLWREQSLKESQQNVRRLPPHENGFYYCCAYKIGEFILCTTLMAIVTLFSQTVIVENNVLQLLKANALANFSKIFLLPIVLWRENTTDIGAALHRHFVLAHHLCALISIYKVMTGIPTLQALLIVLLVYTVKELTMQLMIEYCLN